MEALHRSYREYQRGAAVPNTLPRKTKRPNQRENRTQKTYRKVQISYKMHPLMLQKRNNAIRICTTVMLVFVMMVAVIASNAISAKINLENLSIQENIDNLKEEIDRLNLSISTQCDIQKVAQIAENELSMSFPGDSQVYYIEFDEQTTEQQEIVEPKKNIFENIGEWILGLVG